MQVLMATDKEKLLPYKCLIYQVGRAGTSKFCTSASLACTRS